MGTVGTLIGLLAAQNAQPEIRVSGFNGTQLSGYCEAEVGSPDGGFCAGYVVGVTDGLSMSRRVCASSGVAPMQLVAIVKAYLKANPQRWHYAAAVLVENALTSAFPCPWNDFQKSK